MSGRPLELLAELVRADERHSVESAELDGLAERTASLKQRAEELEALWRSAPAERERLTGDLAAAEAEALERSAESAEAERELAEAVRDGDGERLAAARRREIRARDALGAAARRVDAAVRALDSLDARLEAAEREASQLDQEAAELADTLAAHPRLAGEAVHEPGRGLAGVAGWASGARASLLVARSGLTAEREAVIRQANELGSALLGEPLLATSTAAVVRRVEQATGS